MVKQEPPIWVNYLYFGLLFSILVLLSANRVLMKENLFGSHVFFLLYSFGETALEVALFIFIGWIIRRFLPLFWFNVYIGVTFICFIIHLVDFILDRILNFTVWETLSFVLDEPFDNFICMLTASGIPLWIWGGCLIAIVLIPAIGVVIYHATEWLANLKPFGLKPSILLQFFLCVPIALFLWDCSASRILHHESYQVFIKSLPWKITFFHPPVSRLHLSHPLPPPRTEKEIDAAIERFSHIPTEKPNIYLFVVDSLRNDMIQPHTAPHLSDFRKNCLYGKMSVANANATQIAWFSIFHSAYPYYWRSCSQGSPALRLLCKMGYQIHVYTSADLDYYHMDEQIFGSKNYLATTLERCRNPLKKSVWESDAQTLEAFSKDLAEHPEYRSGHCFIFFWDSTHFSYSWPTDRPPLFTPIASPFNYFSAHSQKTIQSIQNSYKNAVHYIDELFSRFLTVIPDRHKSVICFTSDHGEEFFEHGHIFHLSQLSDVQIQIPLLFQLPRSCPSPPEIACQMDIWPTLIDSITVNGSTNGILDGQSLYLDNRWPYAIIARYNAGRPPYEFCIHSPRHKLIVRFANPNNIFHSTCLNLLSLRTCHDQIFDECGQDSHEWINKEFGDAIDRLFYNEPADPNERESLTRVRQM
jgi:hypothetical protein